VLAAAAVHLAISAFWSSLIALIPLRRQGVVTGAVAGLAIAALDLGVIGRRIPAIRSLPLSPQLADHVAFGAIVSGLLASRRSSING
jgi:hypothetical protein